MLLVRSIAVAAAIAACAAGSARATQEDPDGEPVVLGYVEDAHLGSLGLLMRAKLDTGADTSSVFARDIEIYDKKGKDTWVRFRLVGKDGRVVKYDQNVIRFAHIKTKTGGKLRRPVIRMPICIGGRKGHAEINLADREDFTYDLLIGREFLADRVVVDAGQTHIAVDTCEFADDK